MGRLNESAAYITYLLAIGKKLTYADVERVARRDYVDPEKLLKEVLALAKDSGIASKAIGLAEGRIAEEAIVAAAAHKKEVRMPRERIETKEKKERLGNRYVALLSGLHRARAPDAEKMADAIFAGVGSSELKERALRLSGVPLLAKTATSPERMAQEGRRRQKIAWAGGILRQKSAPVAEAPKERKESEPRTVVLPAPKSVPTEKKPADDTLFFHRKEQEDFARGQGYRSWEDYLEKKEKGLVRKVRAFQGRRKRA